MATAPTGDETLTPDDALDVLEELLDAQNDSYELGLKLKLPLAEVEAIHSNYSKPRSRLLQIIIAFLKQEQSRPTWRVIVDALRSPAVNLPALAKRVEAAHFPDSTSTRDAVPQTAQTVPHSKAIVQDSQSSQPKSQSTLSSVMTTTTDVNLNAPPPVDPTTQTEQPPHQPSAVSSSLSQQQSQLPTPEPSPATHLDHQPTTFPTSTNIPEYEAVRAHFQQLGETLTATPGAEKDLLAHFKERGWIGITATATADQLITKGLNKIKSNVGNYRVFMGMLNGMAGMEEVVSSIEGTLRSQPHPPPRTGQTQVPVAPPSQSPVQTSTISQPHQPASGDTHQLQSQPSSPEPGQMTVQYVEAKIRRFEKRFNKLKNASRVSLERCKIAVKRVTDTLTELPADDKDEHKQFLKDHLSVLYNASDHSELFGQLTLHWNYLSYQLLDHLIKEFDLEVKGVMEAYKEDLQQFREKTPLTLFCKTQRKRRLRLSEDFQEVVAEFDWPDDVTLEVVEQFRQEYACHYSLRECAMMLAEVRPGSCIVTWFIPRSIVDKLKVNVPRAILKRFDVRKLQIAGKCVYRLRNKQMPADLDPQSVTSGPATPETAGPRATADQSATGQLSSQPEEAYPFVEQPSTDFFCPVTFGLLLQPHLTSCCGKHLSQEAAARIQGEGGACPLCKMPQLSTVLNKHFQRQVKELGVFCRHEDRGCGWQGELSDLERHVQSCPMRDHPLMTDLLKLPLYGSNEAELTRAEETIMREHQQRQQKDRELAQAQQRSTLQAVPHSIPTPKPRKSPFQSTLQAVPHSIPTPRPKKLTVQCHRKKTAPCRMIRGSATSDHQLSYFTPDGSNSVYSYQWSTEKWEELPPCPYCDSALVIINGELTAVGGHDGSYTNKLVTLRQRQWVEEYPPMNTARFSTAVVSTSDGEYIIVIGGGGGGVWTATVELFQVSSRRWNKLTNIPQPLPRPSATICGNQLHVIGYDGTGYSCSLEALLSSDGPITSQSIQHLISWTSLPCLPVTDSTAATLSGQLVIIGGMQDQSLVNSIHQLLGGQWVEIGSMSCGRRRCLVVSPSPDKMMIVGGWGDRGIAQDTVEDCVVV